VVGVVGSPRTLIAAGIAAPGSRRSFRVARTEDGRAQLVEAARSTGATALVVPEPLARGDPLVSRALEGGVAVWIVPGPLVDTLCRAALVRTPLRLAEALARLPAIPSARGQLRRLVPAYDHRQLKLL
jgi:hypothetical protein